MKDTGAGGSYEAVPSTRPTRNPQRVGYDRAAVHAVLDEGLVCHVGFVRNGAPVVLPHVYARMDETLILHASAGAAAALAASPDGLAVCVTVTIVDGLVFARSAFRHSVNYRSVVAHGLAEPVEDQEQKRAALTSLVNAATRGRAGQTRPPTAKELAATAVLALPLRNVSLKTRTGPPNDDPDDDALDHWAGVLPLRLAADAPVAASGVTAPVPPSLAHSRWPGPPSSRRQPPSARRRRHRQEPGTEGAAAQRR